MTRAELGVCRRIIQSIGREERRLDGLNDALKSLSASLDGLPRGGGYRSRLDALASARLDCEQGMAELRAILAICQYEFRAWLDVELTNPQHRSVLFLRYGRCLPFEAIAVKLSYSLSHVFHVHKAGLRALEKAQGNGS